MNDKIRSFFSSFSDNFNFIYNKPVDTTVDVCSGLIETRA